MTRPPPFLDKKTQNIHDLGLTAAFSFLFGMATMVQMSHSYTRSSDVANYPQTTLEIKKTFIENGDTIQTIEKIPARVVPDNLLKNIQP